ncbi:autotransporter outer membrane beta-barrel domain-containing protein [Pseudomonas frederiksbergensis]|jgi:outer membrane autotransporter protein|uniref:Autotransporter outer membrane beta-barrel domain-containing protein n=1 Tax=Pseudomonas frederiksbergensis TaxID=104087 RepID=A0A423J6X1_9PSED|nr:autotransporter outer membrane beta-barrel domain-containing protein [Pseudomonas frederiksbergensis]RON33468.1 autotransporter outer membrane beta-barrel domain-containing protein [Pseudomonas frederiksbergensis]
MQLNPIPLSGFALRTGGLYISLLIFSSLAIAAPIVGGNVTLNNGAPVESWFLTQGATLSVNNAQTLGIDADSSTVNVNVGGSTQTISARNNSTVNLSGATVAGDNGQSGLELVSSEGNIDNSTVSGDFFGISAVRFSTTEDGSTVNVTGKSTITGVDAGAFASSHSLINVTDSSLEGTADTGYGLWLQSADAVAKNSTIIGGKDGVFIELDQTGVAPATLSLDNTTVQGKSGSAIVVDFDNFERSTATLTLNNSRLLASNDTLLEVKGGANVSMIVNGSTLNGNVVTESGSTTELTLQNNSVLTGRLENVASATINDTAQWVLVGDSQVGKLALNGGSVKFGAENAFYQLNVTDLSGNGRFLMGTNLATGQTDLLNVTGTATGSHELVIASSGTEPAAGQPVTVVKTAGGDARFSLFNNVVDQGAYSYALAKSGNDWILDPSTRTVSPGARSVLALFNTPLPTWYGELTSLRTRMGELRFNPGQSGAWGRTYGNKFEIADGSGVGYRQTQRGFTLGADAALGDSQWLVGVMGGHSSSDLDLDAGTSGNVDSYYLGTYATWLDTSSGYYADAVLKVNRFRNEAKVSLSDGARAKGDYDNTGVGGSVEFGRHIKLDDGYFIEPFTKWSAVVIQGKHFSLDNDLQADGDRARSLLGEVGMTAGRNFKMKDDITLQPYVRVSGAYEFEKNNEVQVNDKVFQNNLSGSRVLLGTGIAASMTNNLQVHADYEYSDGKNFRQPGGLTLGLRYAF